MSKELPVDDSNNELISPHIEQITDSIETKLGHSSNLLSKSKPSISKKESTRLNQRKSDWGRKPNNDNSILGAIQQLENITNDINRTRQRLAHEEDEFFFFALSVAAQLRKLPLQTAIEIQSKIQNLISETRLQSLLPGSPDSISSYDYQTKADFKSTSHLGEPPEYVS